MLGRAAVAMLVQLSPERSWHHGGPPNDNPPRLGYFLYPTSYSSTR